ncbi:MAG: hypothetical protein HY898_35070 [Deltaproteobacteria bacterium]|nr:hypothetical protein [Deltaproteobacteria bacterium]
MDTARNVSDPSTHPLCASFAIPGGVPGQPTHDAGTADDTPRTTLIRALADSVGRLAAAGDLAAARVASDALASLLRDGSGNAAEVVDLARHKRR